MARPSPSPRPSAPASLAPSPVVLARINTSPSPQPSLAFETCLAQAAKGDAEAQSRLASMYYMGQGVDANLPEAVAWYRKAAEAGEPKAQTVLGMLHEDGEGVARDPAAAAR